MDQTPYVVSFFFFFLKVKKSLTCLACEWIKANWPREYPLGQLARAHALELGSLGVKSPPGSFDWFPNVV